jgi:hypothetical protein
MSICRNKKKSFSSSVIFGSIFHQWEKYIACHEH